MKFRPLPIGISLRSGQFKYLLDSRMSWVSSNPILGDKEMAVEYGSDTFKVGDGVTRYIQLPYLKIVEVDESGNIRRNEAEV